MVADPFEEPPDYKPPQSAQDLLARYKAGERSFGGANLISANLAGVNLAGVNLRGANLTCADLICANLAGANLSTAEVRGANLTGADLTGADFSAADFGGANLTSATLINANLSAADLINANLSAADLSAANLGGASVASTLANIDLTALCDAHPPVIHRGPSTVDHRSVARSIRLPRLKDFLIRAGVPATIAEDTIKHAKARSGSGFDTMRSTFISHGGPDQAFATKLYEALHRNGVTTFLFSEHAVPGERLHRTMRKGVNEHDRVVLICSKASLDRPGVMNEIEETLAREAREGGETLLIPIRLDDYVLKGWKPKREDIAQAVNDRFVPDFEGTDTDPVKFEKALGGLLRALRKDPPETSGPVT